MPHYFDFSVEEATSQLLLLKPDLEILYLSATTGDGFDAWLSSLNQLLHHQSR